MIEDRLIDNKISLRDLLALAVCNGVRAAKGHIDYVSRGPWDIADDMLKETEEMLSHRMSVLGLRNEIVDMAVAVDKGGLDEIF